MGSVCMFLYWLSLLWKKCRCRDGLSEHGEKCNVRQDQTQESHLKYGLASGLFDGKIKKESAEKYIEGQVKSFPSLIPLKSLNKLGNR